MRKFWMMLSASLGLAACQSLPDKPLPPVFDAQAEFSLTLPAVKAKTASIWWENLDAALQSQIDVLLRHNPAIRLVQTQVAEARALLQEADAQQQIQLDANTRNRLELGDDQTNQHSLSLDLTFALDLFDKLSTRRDAASQTLAQRLAELEHTRSEQIQAYVLVLLDGMQAQQTEKLIHAQIVTAQTLLSLTELRFAQGLTTSIDVLQQRDQLAALRQQLPAIKLQQRLAHNQMTRLQGKTPALAISLPEKISMPAQTPYLLGQPAELLENRPDLLAKRAALAAQDRDYAATLQARLPTLNLTLQGLLSLTSGDLSALLSGILNAGMNLLDSGRWQARLDAKAARLERAGIEYLAAWLNAVRQVDDLLHQAKQNQAAITLSTQRMRIAEQLFQASRQVYTQGIGDYLPVLSAVRSLQQQQREHLDLAIEQQRIQVRLQTAMGLTEY